MSALEAADLVKDYPLARSLRELLRAPFKRKLRRALDGLTLTISTGERLALVGPNGAGKTTLARIACGVVLPDGGSAKVDGSDVMRGVAWRGRVGFARPDDPAMHPRLTALEALRFHCAQHGLSRSRAELVAALAELDAAELADRQAHSLSGGEKARISLAKALLHRPALLILDEISRVLDPGAAARTRELLASFARAGGAVLLITHDSVEASLCDRVAVLEAGKVVAQGAWAAVEPKAREVFRL